MSQTQVEIPTPDGDARAFVFKPNDGERYYRRQAERGRQ